MSVRELCEWLEIPSEVRRSLDEAEQKIDFSAVEQEILELTDPKRYEQAQKSLVRALGEDPDGMKLLACMMRSMEHSWELYVERGIPKEIFVDTMKCFPRFIREHKASYGYYGFDRGFWVGRQLSLLLFRLGELEFEKADREEDEEAGESRDAQAESCGDRTAENPQDAQTGSCGSETAEYVVSIHIPSDAVLTAENCREAYRRADAFFAVYCPELAGCEFCCESWLLSPALGKLLPPDSRIIQFQNDFEVKKWNQDSDEFLEWVFKRKDLPVEELPETTSLQRRMKTYLKEGGKVGEAFGVLRRG